MEFFLLHHHTFMQILPGPSFGKSHRGWGSAVAPQILPCQMHGGGPLATNPLSAVAAACPCSWACLLARLAQLARGGSQLSRAEAKWGRAAQGAQPLAETSGTVSCSVGYLWHQGTCPCCREAKLTWLLRVHQSSELIGLEIHMV